MNSLIVCDNNNTMPNRRSIRLEHFDYTTEAGYFITICTNGRPCIFGEIINDQMRLSKSGEIVGLEWLKTGNKRPNIILDEYIVMPNHFHAIILITRRGVLPYARATKKGRVINNAPQLSKEGVYQYAPTPKLRSPSQTLGSIVRGFKAATAKEIKITLDNPDMAVWQRNYYEHIIRNESELNQIRKYITQNPAKWHLDTDNPDNITV